MCAIAELKVPSDVSKRDMASFFLYKRTDDSFIPKLKPAL